MRGGRCWVLLVGWVLVAGCEDDDGGGGGAPDRFRVLVASDIHVRLPGNPDDAVYDAQRNLDHLHQFVNRANTELRDAALVLVTGDLVGCLFSDNPADYLAGTDNPAERFKSIMDGLVMPYRVVLGNHDYERDFSVELSQGVSADDIAPMEAVWKKVLGIDPYYSFIHAGVRFVMLNSCRGAAGAALCPGTTLETHCAGSFDDAQIAWLRDQLQQDEPCLLFLHHPLITDNDARTRWSALGEAFQVDRADAFYDVLLAYRDKVKAVFVGHGHYWATDVLNETIPVYETGSLGDGLGHPDNVHIVSVSMVDGSCNVTIGNPEAAYLTRDVVTVR